MPADINKTTRFEYNLDGNLVKLIAENPTTGDQVTEWIYGVTVAQGSALESKALVYQKKYPDSAGAADRVTYTYNRQGQVVTMKDQAGTTHGYAFDKFGRILEDAASFVPSSPLDKTVQKIARTYEIRGALEKVTSWGLDGTVPVLRNEVLLTYNAYGQLARDYQEHSGAANTATSLFVSYSYADGSANTVRRTGITYPQTETPPTSATTITTEYGGAAADALSRPDALKEGSATLCSYRYLGAGVFIGVKYDAASDVELTYQDGGTGDAGYKYTGLDRFGRLIETLWKKGAAAQVHSKYGRNRFGGVVWRKDLVAHAQGVTTEDNFYQYDGLYQVKEHQRGELTGTPPTGITNLQQEEDWTYDATGNWDSYTNSNPTNSQTRTNNKANEITQITNPGGNMNPAYDPVGNMLTIPTAPGASTTQHALKWDAWNRLVEVKDGATVVATYQYDGMTRRLTKTNVTEARHYFYNEDWRAVEERVAGASPVVDRQYTWGMRDRWDLLRRKRSTGGVTLSEAHYCVKDYLDPVAIAESDGLINERFAYDAFGKLRFLAPDYGSRLGSNFGWEFLFHGEFKDAETRLYNYGYRYYDTSLGRWLLRDPIDEKGGMNLLAFIGNQAISKIDFLGLAQEDYDGDAYNLGFDWTGGATAEVVHIYDDTIMGEQAKKMKEVSAAMTVIREHVDANCGEPIDPVSISRRLGDLGWRHLLYGADILNLFGEENFFNDLYHNPTRAFHGSYGGKASLTYVDCCKGKGRIHIELWDTMGITSATHIPGNYGSKRNWDRKGPPGTVYRTFRVEYHLNREFHFFAMGKTDKYPCCEHYFLPQVEPPPIHTA